VLGLQLRSIFSKDLPVPHVAAYCLFHCSTRQLQITVTLIFEHSSRYFMWLMSERIDKDKSSGAYQDGIIDISGEKIEVVKITGCF
jgi:hypothetical protein